MIYNILCTLIALSLSLIFFGKAVIGIGLGICVILSVIILIQNQAWVRTQFKSILKSRTLYMIFITFGLWFYASYQGLTPEKSIKDTAEIMGLAIGGLLMFSALQTRDFPFVRFFKIVTLSASFCATLLVITPWMGEYAIDCASSYGSALAVLSPMALYCAITSPRKQSILWWVCCALIVSAIFASGGRTAWVAYSIVTILSLIFMPWSLTPNKYANIALVIIVSVLSLFAGLKVYEANVGGRIFDIRTQAMTNTERPMSGRSIVWQDTINYIQEKPLWGYGVKGSHELKLSKGYGAYVRHVHNAPLEMTLETGLIGFTSFLMVIIFMGVSFVRAYFKSDNKLVKFQSLTILMCAISFGIAAMALTSIFYTWWFLVMVCMLVLLRTADLQLKTK